MDSTNTALLQYPTVGIPQINVPFTQRPRRHSRSRRPTTGYPFHRETFRPETVINLLPHLKRSQRYTGTDDSRKITAIRPHSQDSLFHNVLDRTFPSGMDCSNRTQLSVVEQNWDTVRRFNCQTQTGHVCKNSISVIRTAK